MMDQKAQIPAHTKDEIIHGLKSCATGHGSRESHHNNCPYWGNGCFERLIKDVYALVESQNEYIANLETGVPLAALKTMSVQLKEKDRELQRIMEGKGLRPIQNEYASDIHGICVR